MPPIQPTLFAQYHRVLQRDGNSAHAQEVVYTNFCQLISGKIISGTIPSNDPDMKLALYDDIFRNGHLEHPVATLGTGKSTLPNEYKPVDSNGALDFQIFVPLLRNLKSQIAAANGNFLVECQAYSTYCHAFQNACIHRTRNTPLHKMAPQMNRIAATFLGNHLLPMPVHSEISEFYDLLVSLGWLQRNASLANPTLRNAHWFIMSRHIRNLIIQTMPANYSLDHLVVNAWRLKASIL